MTAHATTHVDVEGVDVVFHVDHGDGRASYKVTGTGQRVTVYLTGTPDQLGAFAEAIARTVMERALADVEAAGA